MPQFKIRPGHKLVVADPKRPGQTKDMLGGDVVDLSPDEAAEYPDALDVVAETEAPSTVEQHDNGGQ